MPKLLTNIKTPEPSIVIAAINKNNLIVFLASDTHSGGYPYWDANMNRAVKFKNAGEAQQSLDNTGNQTKSMLSHNIKPNTTRVVRINYTFEAIEPSEVIMALRESGLSKLSEAEKKALGLEV